jgi:hypothetical protein
VWISSASSASICSSVGVGGRSAAGSTFTAAADERVVAAAAGASSESESSAALGGGVAARAGARVRAREREREEGMGTRSSAAVGVAARAAAATAAMGKRVGGGGAPSVVERACGWKVESISALRASSVTARGAGGGNRLDMASEWQRVQSARSGGGAAERRWQR